jgi:hypothetical protein
MCPVAGILSAVSRKLRAAAHPRRLGPAHAAGAGTAGPALPSGPSGRRRNRLGAVVRQRKKAAPTRANRKLVNPWEVVHTPDILDKSSSKRARGWR